MKPAYIPDNSARVLVVGDIILDRYVHGETTRISPEAPVPVVLVKITEERPGGAGNVAINISHLGVGIDLIGTTGEDQAAATLDQFLSGQGVNCIFIKQKGFPTITKLRVLSQHQQLIRLDYEAHSDAAKSEKLFEQFKRQLVDADIVVLSDYAKGSLINVGAYIAECKKHNKKVLIDPKGNDFSRYKGASLLTPNLKEFEAIVGKCRDTNDLVEKGKKLCKTLELESLLVTRGEQGMTLLTINEEPFHLTAEALEVFDVTGAGDTVIATMAAGLVSGYDYKQSTQFANKAAGLVVAKLGAASVTAEELNNTYHQDENVDSHILNNSDLSDLISLIRSRGESIVMTNGCFDILHAGHVNFLQQARKLGDYLIVAVNDDNSVKRLKGEGRPLNPLTHRMAVLAALKPVDAVIPFSEDTPETLIEHISPDVLVKGGDYEPEQIAGAKHVLNSGGSVRIIPLFESCSTTEIINAARKEENFRK